MGEARRLSEMIGLERLRPEDEAAWPTNITLAALGGAILWIAFRFLDWNDARPLYNPWLYVLVTPLVLGGMSLLLRQVVSRLVERTAQVAFLLSVLVHLLLLVYAFDVVIYKDMWPSVLESIADDKREGTSTVPSAPKYFNLAASLVRDAKRPEYLRYVPTEHSASEAQVSDTQRMELAERERAQVTTVDPKLTPSMDPLVIEAQRSTPTMSMQIEAPAALSRADLGQATPARSTADTIDALVIDPPIPELVPSDTKAQQTSPLRSSEARSSESELGTAQPLEPFIQSSKPFAGSDVSPSDAAPSIARSNATRSDSARPPAAAGGTALNNAMRSGIRRADATLSRADLESLSLPPRAGPVAVPESTPAGPVDAAINGANRGPSELATGRRASSNASTTQLNVDVPPDASGGGLTLQPGLAIEPGRGPSIARGTASTSELGFPSLEPTRFPRPEPAGPLAGGVAGTVPTPAFQQRIDRLKDEEVGDAGPVGPQTEQAIERGLKFLAKHQRADGSWKLQDLDPDVLIHSDTAATGLCLLALQGAGYTHKQYDYASVNARALAFLIEHQRPNGDLYIPQDPASDQNAWLYSHGIATLALCEAYGMTQDAQLRPAAQLAVDFMVASQDPQRGGWRYRPGVGADTSVTGWFMMALKSAQLAGLNVPKTTFGGMARYVQASQVSAAQPHLFRYNPFAPDTVEQRHGLQPTHVMTSVGLLMRLYLGWKRDLPEMQAGADYLLTHAPALGTREASQRDTYYWYYATQVMFHMGGQRWNQWNDRLRPLLLDAQITDGDMAGSWDPGLPTPDLWARFGGRLYVTTLNLLSLEVHYRHLPLYEATAQ